MMNIKNVLRQFHRRLVPPLANEPGIVVQKTASQLLNFTLTEVIARLEDPQRHRALEELEKHLKG